MKKALFLAFALFAGSAVKAQYDPKALEILEAMSKKYRAIPSFEANFSVHLTNDVDKVSEEFKGKMTVKGDKYRLSLPEQEVINNGSVMWTYLPDTKEVTIDNFDPGSDDLNPSKFFDMYKKGFKYLFVEEKTEAGVLCEVVDLVPEKKDAQYFRVRMSIAKKDQTILSWTMFDKAGNRYKYTITKFNPDVKLEDAFFSFDVKKYPGVTQTDLR